MPTERKIFYRIIIGLALIALIYYFPLVNANDNTSVSNNNTLNVNYTEKQTLVPSSNQTLASYENGKAKLAAIEPILSYKENMTFWQKKISSQILYIIDPKYPEMGNTREQVKEFLRDNNQLIYFNEVSTKLGFNQTMKMPVEDIIHINIYVKPDVSPRIIIPYAVNVSSLSETEHIAIAWVELNNIEKLASLEEISWIELVGPLRSDTYQQNIINKSILILESTIQITPTQISVDIKPSLPLTSTNVASTLSFFGTFLAVLISGIFSLLLIRISERRG